MFFEQPLSEAFQNVDGKGIFKRKFLKGGHPEGAFRPGGAVASAASTLKKVLPYIEQNAIEVLHVLYLNC
jgi:hypothetical protein